MKSKTIVSTFAFLGVAMSGVAPAMAADDTGFYAGAGAGFTRIKIDDNTLAVAGATASTLTKDESDTGFKIFGGYQFNPNIAVEIG